MVARSTMRYTMSRGVVLMVCLLALALPGCGNIGGKPSITVTPTATPIPYHLVSSIRQNCIWTDFGPATCKVFVTNKPDSNFTFEWRGESDPPAATFSPASGSLAPGQTSGLITVRFDSTICPITLRFVDTQHQLESDSKFNGACGGS